MHIDTSLLREKFAIKSKVNEDGSRTSLDIRVRSNRMAIDLQREGLSIDSFVVRAESMHFCLRVSSQIIADYERKGPFAPRMDQIVWPEFWDNAHSDYDRRFNKNSWLAVYYKGALVYSKGKHHSFLDIVEQFDAMSDTYEGSLEMAEGAFRKAGKDVTIDYNSNIAVVTVVDAKGGRCSMILRTPHKTTTFNYSITPKSETGKVVVSQSLASAGDFLEGVNLSYLVGITGVGVDRGTIEKYSDQYYKAQYARERLGTLNARINSLENRYRIRYRPERPMFDFIISQAERYAESLPMPEEEDQEENVDAQDEDETVNEE